jgi:hypothetical protein
VRCASAALRGVVSRSGHISISVLGFCAAQDGSDLLGHGGVLDVPGHTGRLGRPLDEGVDLVAGSGAHRACSSSSAA